MIGAGTIHRASALAVTTLAAVRRSKLFEIGDLDGVMGLIFGIIQADCVQRGRIPMLSTLSTHNHQLPQRPDIKDR